MAEKNKNNSLSDREFSDYYKNKMSDRKAHDFEARATDDDFISDATDGFMEHPEALEDLGKLKEKFNKSNNINTGFSAKSIAVILVAALVVLIFGIILLTKPTIEKQEFIAINNDSNQTKENKDAGNTTPIDTLSKTSFSIDESTASVSPKKVIVYQKEIKSYEEDLPLKKLEKKSILTIDLDNKIQKLRKKKITFHYLADFKVVDYSNVYSHQPKKDKTLTGLPAEYEANPQSEDGNKVIQIEYDAYLETALRKLKIGDISSAISHFKTILETYPEDLNADFYLGICYFNINKFDEASHYFKSALISSYYVFDEETEWYLYLSYKNSNKNKEALNLLKLIKERKGFYFKKANQE